MEKVTLKTTNTSGVINTTTTSDINYFDFLADDLKVNILCQLRRKHLARLTLVSKAWHRLIIDRCLPNLSFKQFGLLLCTRGSLLSQLDFLDSRAHLRDNVRPLLFNPSHDPRPKLICLNFGQELLDCCNGLLLYRHRDQKIISKWFYYVVNPITKQSVTIANPSPNVDHVYAALVYDASKSEDFKVVQFDGSSCLNIYSSENRVWINRKYQFEDCIASANWLRQSIYFNGAIYRLSMSGHLLKFDVEEAVNVKSQAIDLPGNAKKHSVGCAGLSNGRIKYAVTDTSDLHIWELHHQCNEYEWLSKYRFPYLLLQNGGSTFSYIKPFGFHPYLDVIFLGVNNSRTYSINICNLLRLRLEGAPLTIMDSPLANNMGRFFSFPFLQSFVPLKGGTVDESTCGFGVLYEFQRWWESC